MNEAWLENVQARIRSLEIQLFETQIQLQSLKEEIQKIASDYILSQKQSVYIKYGNSNLLKPLRQ